MRAKLCAIVAKPRPDEAIVSMMKARYASSDTSRGGAVGDAPAAGVSCTSRTGTGGAAGRGVKVADMKAGPFGGWRLRPSRRPVAVGQGAEDAQPSQENVHRRPLLVRGD